MTQVIQENIKSKPQSKPTRTNDFCLTICTVNGSGSATANTTLYRSLFRMGIPVSGKNIFPSNIKGQPTWFVIRASEAGYLARVAHDDIVVAMNAETIAEDLTYIVPGGVLFYADHIALPETREDLITYPMPIKALVKQAEVPRNLRDYMENMLYVGIVAQMIGIDLDSIYESLRAQFSKKLSVADSNFEIVKLGANWAKENLIKGDAYQVEKQPSLNDYIMTDGNTAGALGALYGGMQFCGWYPITPASSMVETMIDFAPKIRKDPETGKETYAIIQAEDELSAIGMACGAGWGGLRSMTSTSGPGLSLMTEYLGLAYYSETPIVIWDVQRVGPSTGLPTRTSQGDLTMVYFMGHGDTNQIILLPGSVNECFELGWQAFDFAERLQTPVFVMSDLDLGMNYWMTRKFVYPDKEIDRGKVLWEKDLEVLHEEWGRYLDKDGDGIPYRTVLGNLHPGAAYFSRGTGHDEYGNYSEDPKVWKDMLDRLKLKFETARHMLPKPIFREMKNAKIGLISMGSTDPALIEAQDILEMKGLDTDYMRIRALPGSDDVRDFISHHERNYVLELNRDGQLHQILTLESPEHSSKLISLSICDGLPMTAEWIKSRILEMEDK
ncbi:MAG: 2-oxoacid:acceptor oxidoreductase subunit alpha [Anaerolineaceae bacterium]|nr:2-oxoacid:acceptor oxidoreductase subunit alpha [Anaerolineaceae bacterium]